MHDDQIVTLMQDCPEVVRALKDAESEIAKTNCRNPAMGSFFEACGFEYWKSLLSLETDEEVRTELNITREQPVMNQANRHALLDSLEKHKNECLHCNIMAEHDAVFVRQFDNAIALLSSKRVRATCSPC